jgi:hypothetical protein
VQERIRVADPGNTTRWPAPVAEMRLLAALRAIGVPGARGSPHRGSFPAAARSKWARIEALLRNRAFIAAYTCAREAWRAGVAVMFPPGTYWLRRFAQVAVAET